MAPEFVAVKLPLADEIGRGFLAGHEDSNWPLPAIRQRTLERQRPRGPELPSTHGDAEYFCVE